MSIIRNFSLLTIGGVVILCSVLAFFGDAEQWIGFVTEETHWALFVALMTVLPIFAFPITLFLVLAGVKFGFIIGSLLTLLIIPVHLIASFILGKSLLRPYLDRILAKKNVQLPRIPQERTLMYASLFVMIPGPPYSLKNYTLALTGIPFRYYFLVNWVIELVLCIPVVGLGESIIALNWKMILIYLVLIATLYLAGCWLKGWVDAHQNFSEN
jgi:uncharacterized membrane protein YdjX (TVP38/TMEM64 family)